jgi:hypothetical protein
MSILLERKPELKATDSLDRWIPLYSWARELPDFHCRLNIYPRIVTRNAADVFRCRLRFFSRQLEPLGEYETGEVTGDEVLRLPLRQVADAMGLPVLSGVMEVQTFQVDRQPDVPRFLKCWMDFENEDRTWFASLPCAPFRGARKSMMAAESQVQPGIVADPQYKTYLLAINPMPRPARFELTAYNAEGRPLTGFRHQLESYDFLFREMEEIYPDLPSHFAPGGIGSVRIDGDYKLLAWYVIENRETGRVYCMDHFAPFFRDIRSDNGA